MTSVQSINFDRPQRYMMMTSNTETKPERKRFLKPVAVLSSVAGMGTALALISKKQGFSLSPKVIARTPIRDWVIFKIANKNEPNRKLLELEEKEIIGLATGSVLGGLIGGGLYDRKNFKAKLRESLTQMVGNVLIPVAFVGFASRRYKAHDTALKSAMPQFKNLKTSKFVGGVNKFIQNIPAVGITGLALGLGIFTGSKVTNFINDKFFGQKEERKIKSTDFAPHVDDLCLAVTLMGSKNSPLASTITRTVPAFLSVPGYQVAKAQEK